MQQVLIVDDEPDIRALLEITLGRMGLQTAAVGDLGKAREVLAREQFDLCLTDMRLPDGDGLELVGYIQSSYPHLPVAVITAYGSVDTAVSALKAGAFDFVSKPVDLTVLRRLVNSALSSSRRDRPKGTQRPALIGDSPVMNRLRETIAKLARSQAPVYISGESGSGKELVARLIHLQGARAERPFVPVNCGAIPAELMESELFGHLRGSFTGAVADKRGLFQSAEGGTLFLDEVADLPAHMQVKLLRAIQERAVRPVGANEEIALDVRILSATHKDIAQLVAEDRFREDLYYRINVIEIKVPSIRERPEDVPQLVDHILGKVGRRNGCEAPEVTDQALHALRQYPFPGNVRELENILERAMTLCDGGVIQPEDLRLPVVKGAEPKEQRVNAPLPTALGTLEREAIERAMESHRWNRTQAAKELGLTLRQLRYRLKKLGLE